MENENQTPNPAENQDPFAIMKILWLAFIGSTGIFIVVMFITPPNPSQADETMQYVLMGMSAFMAVLSFQVPRFFRQQIQRQHKGQQLSREKKAQLDYVPTLLSFVFSEAVGVFGLVLALTTGNKEMGLPFCIAAMVLLAVHKPKERF